ncbi:MAG: hypothetical protein IIC73_05055, partial [Armatimonadetes bacterium]|nr:hypothetical protein [Armatimonadota bacterium]
MVHIVMSIEAECLALAERQALVACPEAALYHVDENEEIVYHPDDCGG